MKISDKQLNEYTSIRTYMAREVNELKKRIMIFFCPDIPLYSLSVNIYISSSFFLFPLEIFGKIIRAIMITKRKK